MSTPCLTLVVAKGPAARSEFPLASGTFTIGRDADADLILVADDFVSGHHAKVVIDNGTARLRNLSPNGTLVNGRPVMDAKLAAGDRISIGSLYLLAVQGIATGHEPAPLRAAATADPARERPRATATTTDNTSFSTNASSARFRMPIWLSAYLVLMCVAFVFFGYRQLTGGGTLTLKDLLAHEEQYSRSRKLDDADLQRIVRLLETAVVHERRGDPRSAYETYREILAVRRPVDPDAPTYRYAASRLAALGAK